MAVCFNDAVIHLLHRSLTHLESAFSAIMHTMLRDNLEYTGVSGSWKDPELCVWQSRLQYRRPMGKSPGSIYIYHIHHRLLQRCAAVQYSTLLNAKVLCWLSNRWPYHWRDYRDYRGLTKDCLTNNKKKVLNSPCPEETSAPRNKDLCLHYFDLSIISVLRMCYITVLWWCPYLKQIQIGKLHRCLSIIL